MAGSPQISRLHAGFGLPKGITIVEGEHETFENPYIFKPPCSYCLSEVWLAEELGVEFAKWSGSSLLVKRVTRH